MGCAGQIINDYVPVLRAERVDAKSDEYVRNRRFDIGEETRSRVSF